MSHSTNEKENLGSLLRSSSYSRWFCTCILDLW